MASYRKSKLNDNSAFLQFNWKADVVESWIGMYPSYLLLGESIKDDQFSVLHQKLALSFDPNNADHVSRTLFFVPTDLSESLIS